MGEPALQVPAFGGEKSATRGLLRRVWDRHFVPRRRRDIGQWSETEVTLTSEETEDVGRFSLARTPYARFVLALLSPQCLTRATSFRAPAQLMKTMAGLLMVGHRITDGPCRIWMVFPTDILAKDFKRDRWDVLVENTPALRALIPRQRARDGAQTKTYVKFPGGSLKFVGANVPWSLRSTPVKVIVLEEYNALSRALKGEGTAAGIAEARARRVRRAKIYRNSTPTVAGASAVTDALRDAEACFEYRVPCPHCGHLQRLEWAQVRYEKPVKRPEGGKLDCIPGVTVECLGCHEPIEERHKHRMAAAAIAFGEQGWHAKWDLGRASVGLDGASLALLAERKWGEMAAKYERGLEDPQVMREFQNLDLGVDYEEATDAPDTTELYNRREPYPVGIVPPGARVLVAGVDAQKGWLACEVVAYGRNWESWSVDYRVIVDDTTDPEQGAWKILKQQVLDVAWPCHGGGTLPIRCMAIDSGYNPEPVYAFAKMHPPVKVNPKGTGFGVKQDRTVMVVKGRDTGDRLVGIAQAVSADEKKRGVKVFLVGSGKIRETQYEWLKQVPLTEAERAAGDKSPRGLCHFPDAEAYSLEYFGELTGAVLETVLERGFPRRRWRKPKGVRHEAGDCRNYARAAAIVVGVDRARESDWRALEARLPPGLLEGGVVVPAPKPKPVDPPRPDMPPEATPTPSMRVNRPGARRARYVSTWLHR